MHTASHIQSHSVNGANNGHGCSCISIRQVVRSIICIPVSATAERPGSEELGAGGELLTDHARDGNHRQAAVVELLVLHLEELGRVGGLQAQRVEAHIACDVVRLDRPEFEGAVRALGGLEGEDGEDLEDGEREDHREEATLQRRLLERDVRRDVDVAT